MSRYHPKDCKTFPGSITISAARYLQFRRCWGDGAVLVHEFAHAVHDKLIPSGFACEIIEKVGGNVYYFARVRPLRVQFHDRLLGKQWRVVGTNEFLCTKQMAR